MANTKSKITLSAELRPGPHSWNEIPVMRDVSLWVKEPSVCAVGWGVGAGSCLEFSCVLPQSLLLALWVRYQVVRGMFHPLQRVLGARKPLWRPPFLQGIPYELLMSLTREKTQRWLWRAVTDVALRSDPCDPCFRIRFRLVPQPTAGLSDPSRELLSDEGDTPSWGQLVPSDWQVGVQSSASWLRLGQVCRVSPVSSGSMEAFVVMKWSPNSLPLSGFLHSPAGVVPQFSYPWLIPNLYIGFSDPLE